MILALAGLLAVVVGTAFGGRGEPTGRASLPRHAGSIVIALAAQVAAFPSGMLPWHTGDAWPRSLGRLLRAC